MTYTVRGTLQDGRRFTLYAVATNAATAIATSVRAMKQIPARIIAYPRKQHHGAEN